MKIYIASPHDCADFVRELADVLEEDSHDVVSTWFRQDVGYVPDMSNKAINDMDDIRSADGIIIYNPKSHNSRGGFHTELGIALALEKRIFLLGERTNVFHWLLDPHEQGGMKELKLWLST